MSLFKHILVALDLSEQSSAVLNKANTIAQQNKAKITVVHVVEPIIEPVNYAYDGNISVDLIPLQDEVENSAKKKLNELATPLGILNTSQIVPFGRPADEVHRVAKENNCDLIIVGSHGRHGLGLLLGSTANAVLHGATCDVLAVRV